MQKFYLKKELLPGNISPLLGQRILFIGRIVWIVNNGPEINNVNKYEIKLKRDVWNGASMEYYEMIKSLELHPSSIYKFERIIEECRCKLTEVSTMFTYTFFEYSIKFSVFYFSFVLYFRI